MLVTVWSVAVSVALGANPAYPSQPSSPPSRGIFQSNQVSPLGARPSVTPASCSNGSCGGGGGASYGDSYGGYGMSYDGGMSGAPSAYATGGAFPGNEPLYPYDSQSPWMHGYFQEVPAYGGFVYFRPYNYKHVMPQSQTSAGWGMQPTMPYSHQFWHRFKQPASMSPQLSNYRTPASARTPSFAGSKSPVIRGAVPVNYSKPAGR